MSHPTISPSTTFHQHPSVLFFCKSLLNCVHFVVRISAPVAYSGLAGLLLRAALSGDRLSLYACYLLLWCLVEVAFHLTFLHRRHALARTDPYVPMPFPDAKERQRVLDGLLSSFQSAAEIRACFAGWFYARDPGSPVPWDGRSGSVSLEAIHYDNAAELLACILFSSPLEALNSSRRAELAQDLARISSKLDYAFPPGRNPTVHPMRHILEPVRTEHRPFWLYFLVACVRLLVDTLYIIVGFRQHAVQTPAGTMFTYWFHSGYTAPHANQPAQPPLVILAGIGGLVSLPHYVISLLWASNRPIFLVGNNSVSLTLWKEELELLPLAGAGPDGAPRYRRKILTLAEQASALRTALQRHGFAPTHRRGKNGGAFVVGHSLGTLLTSYFSHRHPEWVCGTLSIDPISVLPFIPNLALGFVYSDPDSVGSLLVRLIAREIGVATVIQRHFYWWEFVGFAPTIAGGKHHFVLSEDDALVCHEQVAEHLVRTGCPVTTLKGAPHAGFLVYHLQPVVSLTLALMQQAGSSSGSTPASPSSLKRSKPLQVAAHSNVHPICIQSQS